MALGRVGRKHWLLLSLSLLMLLLAAPVLLLRYTAHQQHSERTDGQNARGAKRTNPATRGTAREHREAERAAERQRAAERIERQRAAERQRAEQQQCRRQVPAAVALEESDRPLTFAFPTSSRHRTACYQPTTQVPPPLNGRSRGRRSVFYWNPVLFGLC